MFLLSPSDWIIHTLVCIFFKKKPLDRKLMLTHLAFRMKNHVSNAIVDATTEPAARTVKKHSVIASLDEATCANPEFPELFS